MSSSRLFDTSTTRAITSLDGPWDIHFPLDGTEIEPLSWEILGTKAERVAVPCCWESVLPDRATYRGEAVLRRQFETTSEGPVRLVFKGVSHTCRVFLDGDEIGGHHNAYTAFSIDVPMLDEGEHELLVHVSNAHGEISALHVSNDYYNYGGITRPCELQELMSPLVVDRVLAEPQCDADGNWSVQVAVDVTNLGEATEENVGVDLWLLDEPVKLAEQPFPAGTTRVESVIECGADIDTWSPGHPQLYEFAAVLVNEAGDTLDDLIDRIGFRTVQVEGESILLNGKPMHVWGFNRHEDHPDYGCAIPVEMMRKDLMLMVDMGCNAVRTSHYPNDERFLDLCDELGFLVWEENHARGLYEDNQIKHPRFREQCEVQNCEMVLDHFNHPSIVLWGILNECASHTEYGRERYAEQFAQIKSLDTSRPTTFASFRYEDDCCQDLPDVAGWNRYARWYGDCHPLADIDKIIATNEAKGMKGKPLILSEFGGGAIPGYSQPFTRVKWSEENQLDILDEVLEVYCSHPRATGWFIWQFCDVRVDEGWAMRRPRCYNNKGIVDELRRPKLAYAAVKKHFTALAERFPHSAR